MSSRVKMKTDIYFLILQKEIENLSVGETLSPMTDFEMRKISYY